MRRRRGLPFRRFVFRSARVLPTEEGRAQVFFTGSVEKGQGVEVFPRRVLGGVRVRGARFFYKILDLYLSVWDFCLPLHSLAGRERCSFVLAVQGELSSAGSERLPYKQRVGGSNPSAPTVFPARGARNEKGGEKGEKRAGRKAHRKDGAGRCRKEAKTPLFRKTRHIDPIGSLAQLVQSVCLTSRGSGVRIPQLPQTENPASPAADGCGTFL